MQPIYTACPFKQTELLCPQPQKGGCGHLVETLLMQYTVHCGHIVMALSGVPPQDGDTVITRLSWADRMESEDEVNYKLETTEEQPKGDKIHLIKVIQPTEDFLHEVFNPAINTS